MKILRKLRILVLLFAIPMLVMGFTTLSAPRIANAAHAAQPMMCCTWVCMEVAPYLCMRVCFHCHH